jgi:hypothetical protein
MRWLADRLGADRLFGATVILPTDEFFPDPYRHDEASARACLTRMCGYMRADPRALTLTVLPDEAMRGASGLYQRGARKPFPAIREKSKVFVAASQLAHPMSLMATLAHEIGHEILLGGGLLTSDVPDHEEITDLLTVFLGVGVFNANATVHESSWNYGATYSGWSIGRHGYLSTSVFGYALGVFAYVREEAAPRWARHLRPDARGALRQGLKYLRKTGDGLFRPDNAHQPRGLPTATQVAEGLVHRSPTFRLGALWELNWAGLATADLLPAVVRCLDDQDPGVRAESARALAGFGPEAEVAVPRLVEIVQTDDDIWTCALPALAALRAAPALVIPEVARLLMTRVGHAELLASVARAYGPAAEPAVPALLTAFGRQLVRGEVRNLLAAVRELVPDPEGAVRAHFAADPELVRDALWALRQPVE